MSGKPFLDTNIVVYAFSSDDARSETAEALLAAGGVISVQVLNEFVNVSRRKQGRGWDEIEDAIGILNTLLDPPRPLTADLHKAAIGIARQYSFSIYDSLIVAAALEAGCSTLYSEDLHGEQKIGHLTIRNPFDEQHAAGAAVRQPPLTPLEGSGRCLWGKNGARTLRRLRDEWSR